jgi:DNA-binding transcriptional MerR regulator
MSWISSFVGRFSRDLHWPVLGDPRGRTGLSIDAIRFYERKGLLRHPPRTQGGFRLFSRDDIETLLFIRKAQELGFSLSEIGELLVLRDERLHACTHMRDLLAQKLAAVREKIAELQSLEETLQAGLRKCNRELKTDGGSHRDCCPVLDEISRPGRLEGVKNED